MLRFLEKLVVLALCVATPASALAWPCPCADARAAAAVPPVEEPARSCCCCCEEGQQCECGCHGKPTDQAGGCKCAANPEPRSPAPAPLPVPSQTTDHAVSFDLVAIPTPSRPEVANSRHFLFLHDQASDPDRQSLLCTWRE